MSEAKDFDQVVKAIKNEPEVKPAEVIEGITEDAASEISKTKSQLEKDFWKAFNKLASQDEYKIGDTVYKRRAITRKEDREIKGLQKQLAKIDKEADWEHYMEVEEMIYRKFAHYCLVNKNTDVQMSDNEFDNSPNEILQRVLDAIFYKLEAGLPFVQQTSKSY